MGRRITGRRITRISIVAVILSALALLITCEDTFLRTYLDEQILGWTRAVTLKSPESEAKVPKKYPFLNWEDSGGAAEYIIAIADSADALDGAEEIRVTEPEYTFSEPASIGEQFFWRVCAVDENGERGEWSEVWNFQIFPSDRPRIVKTITTNGAPQGIYVESDLLIVATSNELSVYDIRDKINPVKKMRASGNYQGILLDGTDLYVCDIGTPDRLVRFDVDNAFDAQTVETLSSEASVTLTDDPRYLCLDTEKTAYVCTDTGIAEISNADGDSPVQTDFNDSPVTGYTLWGLTFDGFLTAVVTSPEYGIHVFDVMSDRDFKGSLAIPGIWDYPMIDMAGSRAYVAAGNPGLIIIDIGDQNNPTKVGTYATQGGANSISVTTQFAFVFDLQNGLLLLDLTEDPDNPTLIGSNPDIQAKFFSAYGNYFYGVNYNTSELYVVDLVPE